MIFVSENVGHNWKHLSKKCAFPGFWKKSLPPPLPFLWKKRKFCSTPNQQNHTRRPPPPLPHIKWSVLNLVPHMVSVCNFKYHKSIYPLHCISLLQRILSSRKVPSQCLCDPTGPKICTAMGKCVVFFCSMQILHSMMFFMLILQPALIIWIPQPLLLKGFRLLSLQALFTSFSPGSPSPVLPACLPAVPATFAWALGSPARQYCQPASLCLFTMIMPHLGLL